MAKNLEIRRIKDPGGREATLLSNGIIRIIVTDKGGMVPELSIRRQNGWLNAHWQPQFRSNSGIPYDETIHQAFWPVELLYELAGNFPCFPNFGPPGEAYGVAHQAHGLTANGVWQVESSGVIENKCAYIKSNIAANDTYPSLPISYTKFDMVAAGQPVHYALLTAKNEGSEPLMLNAAWHNTIAPPFLAAGCLIDACADSFAIAPAGGEFDTTGRLSLGAEFDDLKLAPLKDGGTADLRSVPGMIGYTDLICGAVPKDAILGWSAVTNPFLDSIYMTFFKGPAAAGPSDMNLNFNDYWMQYGGRDFPPWAYYEGGTDYTFCLGTENATGAYANGLGYSLEHREVLGRPTLIEIGPGEEKRLSYGTSLFNYQDKTMATGVRRVDPMSTELAVEGHSGSTIHVAAYADFASVEKIADSIGTPL